MPKPVTLLCAALLLYCPVFAAPPEQLKECWKKQARALRHHYLQLSYAEARHNLYHSSEPWQTYAANSNGIITMDNDICLKIDSTKGASKTYVEKRQLTSNTLLVIEPGDTTFAPVTKTGLADELFETLHYTPLMLVSWFYEHNILRGKNDNGATVYSAVINGNIAALYINNVTHCVDKATLLKANGMYGDVLTTFNYSRYMAVNGLPVAHTVTIGKTNGKAIDTVTIANAVLQENDFALLQKPENFTWKTEPEKDNTCTSKKINPHINLVNIPNADAQILIVEFAGFMAVINAPLNSENGELIIREAQKIAANKPIKYFAFGHHHPWSLAGVRPFIRQGATILTIPDDNSYIGYLASAPHTLQPDSLQHHPTPLITQGIKDSVTITDGSYAMKIYIIGKASNHTNDYAVVYFPGEKLLYEDDLISIKSDGTKQKASKRQAGLYGAVKSLNLDVATIIQSWPVTQYGYKSIIPFNELQESIE